jgi:hypothetical protein
MTLLTVVVILSGCLSTDDDDDVVQTGELRTDDAFVHLGDAEAVRVNLELGRGDLELRPGASKLMEGTFVYNVDRWKPELTYVEEGEVWNLTVVQPNADIKVESGARNEWNLQFTNAVPIEMNVDIGAGNGDVKVGGLDLASLSVGTGAGDIDADLTGGRYDHLIARFGTGVGNVRLVVPEYYGVQISVGQGAGTVTAPGFSKVGENYVNDAFDTAQILLLLSVSIGTGDLVVLEVP